jgi:hypothetical protein
MNEKTNLPLVWLFGVFVFAVRNAYSALENTNADIIAILEEQFKDLIPAELKAVRGAARAKIATARAKKDADSGHQ